MKRFGIRNAVHYNSCSCSVSRKWFQWFCRNAAIFLSYINLIRYPKKTSACYWTSWICSMSNFKPCSCVDNIALQYFSSACRCTFSCQRRRRYCADRDEKLHFTSLFDSVEWPKNSLAEPNVTIIIQWHTLIFRIVRKNVVWFLVLVVLRKIQKSPCPNWKFKNALIERKINLFTYIHSLFTLIQLFIWLQMLSRSSKY